jgi:hypothetical protein
MHQIPLLHGSHLMRMVLPTFVSTSTIMSAITIYTTTASGKFTMLSLGQSANVIKLLVHMVPSIHDTANLKAHSCFDYLTDIVLISHAPLYSSAELIMVFVK